MIYRLPLSFVFTALLVGCTNTYSVSNTNDMAITDADTARLAEQMTMGLNWMQQSGEYRALAYQAFNAATVAFDRAKVKRGVKKAVTVDLDETVIDNTPYDAWQIQVGKLYEPQTWAKWTQAKQATVVPGAVEFANHVVKNGGAIFYVSNRKVSELADTIANLKTLGFPNVSEETVLLKSDNSNKQPRFDSVIKAGYKIVVMVGDNLNDLGEATYHKDNAARRAFADAHAKDFGTSYIVLPNPIYGDWEGGMAKDYWKKSPAERLQIRRDNLRIWDGK